MYCKTVWNGIHILPDGYTRMCSLGQCTDPKLDKQRCRDKDGNLMHILTHSVKEIFNSDKHREVRLLDLKDTLQWSPHCECCQNMERVDNTSRRINLMNLGITSNNLLMEEGYVDGMPSSLDIRFGNLCNMKCIMCSPSFSNQWYDEYEQFYEKTTFGQANVVQMVKNEHGRWTSPLELKWYEDPRWWTKFEEMAPYLRHIYVTGGEPMIVPAHNEMLDRLIANGQAKDITLEYDTNASVMNTKLQERWSSFKKVYVRASMDGMGGKYELIRYPGNWLVFQANVRALKQLERDTNKKVELQAVTTCVQIATVLDIVNQEQWCKDNDVPYHIRFLEGPEMHAVASLPTSIKEQLLEYYRKSVMIAKSDKATQVAKHIYNHMGPEHEKPEAIAQFINFMNHLDKSRGTSWASTLPQVFQLLLQFAEHEKTTPDLLPLLRNCVWKPS